MAIRRTSNNSINNAVKLSTGFASAAIPNTPTIGTATAVSDVAATVAYTAAVLGATGTTFTATSNPGSVTGTGSSPITVTGLTASTSYTFSVTAGNANGTSAASSASNSITTSAPLTSYQSIATVTVGSGGSSTITFSSIPSTFTHLQIRGIGRDDLGNSVNMTFNSDTGTNYARHRLIGNGTTASATGTTSLANIPLLANAGLPTAANIFAPFVIDILDYTNTNKYTTARVLSGKDSNGSGGVDFTSGLWLNTNVISNITLTGASGAIFQQYSTFALYGIKGA